MLNLSRSVWRSSLNGLCLSVCWALFLARGLWQIDALVTKPVYSIFEQTRGDRDTFTLPPYLLRSHNRPGASYLGSRVVDQVWLYIWCRASVSTRSIIQLFSPASELRFSYILRYYEHFVATSWRTGLNGGLDGEMPLGFTFPFDIPSRQRPWGGWILSHRLVRLALVSGGGPCLPLKGVPHQPMGYMTFLNTHSRWFVHTRRSHCWLPSCCCKSTQNT